MGQKADYPRNVAFEKKLGASRLGNMVKPMVPESFGDGVKQDGEIKRDFSNFLSMLQAQTIPLAHPLSS